MTVIAWDGKTLAADKLCCNGSTRNTTTKIFRHGDDLLAVTGDLSGGMEMLYWYRDGAESSKFPPANRDPQKSGYCSLIVIKSDKTVWKYEVSPYPFLLEGSFNAFGCADEAALVAMACGKSAAQAIELVSRFNTGCGNGIDVLEMA